MEKYQKTKNNHMKTEGMTKKDQFQKSPNRKGLFIAAAIAVVVLGAALMMLYNFDRDAESEAAQYLGESVTESRSYIGEVVSMTEIEPMIEDGWLTMPLAVISEHNIVYFEMDNDEGFSVPLMAYITPSGRLFAGSSMCEPCQGRTFSLAGETLVCDTCRTTYTIEDQRFISGSTACGAYPPVNMNPLVENGLVKIPLEKVLEWRTRSE